MLPIRSALRLSSRFASVLKVSSAERDIILNSFSNAENKAAFQSLGNSVPVDSLNNLFAKDPVAIEKFLEAIMDTIEVDQEKKLSFAEFLVIMVKRKGVNGVQNAFLSQDKDRSGSISRDELKEWMTKYGHFLTRKQVQTMVDAVDVNGDGEIDYGEFLNLVCQEVLQMKSE
ncbi:Oidioi.mRNA.OKI2018_I69.chr2.g4397.t1.cds [Oikopleura dioica]|uniref:Oidioi.mRNA.OKI2018_I69.chr2.g4397.t1.cds n=1 Tax=Oikopleura dioica TaxID=34765 RepID=A0ABN7SX93_OIKDI|nr:Oidioi.mRNA.OKI2018_I69.chr2.g4397.t1.cds [Oikopleura dioica]